MTHELTIAEPGAGVPAMVQNMDLAVDARRVQAVAEMRKSIRSFIASQLTINQDYGAIPGCGTKPVLLQPGADKILMVMNCFCDSQTTITDLGNGHREYSVRAIIRHIPTGNMVAVGEGSCSTLESKYRYRDAKKACPSCGASVLLLTKRGQWWCPQDKGGCGANFDKDSREIQQQIVGKVDNPDVADQYNTVLKMAVKRAKVAAVLNLNGGWSDHFTQDEDAPAFTPPASTPNSNMVTYAQWADDLLTSLGVPDKQKSKPALMARVGKVAEEMGFPARVSDIPPDKLRDVLAEAERIVREQKAAKDKGQGQEAGA